ncbi:sensor domain-containing diguanylate cyclase [Thiocystis violacea]|uniref:sensor domain-containing diguanylate cyclase n=1 Tax=Thiocystis violacea TaxID=13725 RepID=UPI0019047A81|nr:sensor domain-containing diguanylate cyclase [Thiocystis violacea]MBK1721134.1 GGDEF domain-containing protein [Thiocystis violacea]
MKATESWLADGRLRSRRMGRNLAWIFGFLGLLLIGTMSAQWLFVLEPALREEAGSRAAAMAQAHAQSLEQVLRSRLPPAALERELRTTMGSVLLLADPATRQPFVRRVSLSLDYEFVEAPRGSLDVAMGQEHEEGCFISRVPLYDPKTQLLIGVATFHSNAFFVERLLSALRTKLLWGVGIIIGLTGFAWVQSNRLLKRLGVSEANLRQVFEAAPFPMVLNGKGQSTLRQANRAARAYLELTEDAAGRLSSPIWRQLQSSGLPVEYGAPSETGLQGSDGRQRWALVSTMPVSFSGSPSRLVTMVDISELKAIQDELKLASQTDGLTGLYNRRFLYQHLAKEIELVRRYGHPLSIVLFDLDHFKAINDAFGHRTGDEVLIQFAAVLKSSLREVDVAGRYGGEEFLVVLPNSNGQQALEAAGRIAVALKSVEWEYEGLQVTVSGGVSEYRGETLDAFIDSADKKLYQVKENGRDGILI